MLDTTVCTNEIFLRNYKPTIHILQTLQDKILNVKLQDKILSKRFTLTLKMRGFNTEHGGTLHDMTDWC